MPLIKWSDNFSVNVKEIDAQHKALMDKINILHDNFVAKKGQAGHKAIIDAMVDYASKHFATEEKYMQKFQYSDYSAHKAEHDKFTKKAIELQERFEDSKMLLTMEIILFLKNWLQQHILGTDQRYSKHFNSNGLH